ncbi:MAG: DEAD/DEAH box helicase [Sedimentisphaerales bacterium]|nr:DEAD/DEAH box helicase [Sedimentisphaerales bacterium]
MAFRTMGLSEPLVRGIQASGYTTPTEIQSQAIPAALSDQDIIGCAKTGTGKTAAFVLPILDRLLRGGMGKGRIIKSLILTPTRELAVQIERSIRTYGKFTSVRTLAVYGGVSMNRQLDALRRGVDIVVATPGRLMDHMRRHSIDLRSVEVLVLDEADRMFDMGFIADVQKIVAAVPTRRQTMLFSATIPPEVQRLAAGIQQSPLMIEIGEQHNPIETITQCVHAVNRDQKLDLLVHMLQNKPMYSVLVFSRTKHGADKIHRKLERAGVNSVAIHSGRSQAQRQRALDGFRSGKYQVMVATDIAARGIDVRGISHVVNFDVPAYAEDYIHRIGRTGRATATGDAITLVSPDERDQLSRIERFIGNRIKLQEYDGFTCAHFAAVLSQSPQRAKAQRQVLRARRASKRPRFSRGRRGLAGAHAGR